MLYERLSGGGRAPIRQVARQGLPLLVALAYLAAAVVGLAATRDTNGLAALWPPNAILLAMLLLRPVHPWRYVAWCACAAFAANLWFGSSAPMSLVFTLANVAGVIAATALGRRLGLGPTAFDRPADIVRFCASALLGATVGAVVAAASVRIAPADMLDVGASWFLSDLLGMLVITPLGLMLAWARRHPHGERRVRRPRETAALLALVLVVSCAVFFQSRYPLLFLPVAPLMAVTYRLGPTGTAAGIILVAAIGITATLSGSGPVALAAGSTAVHVHFLQFYLAALFGICLPAAAALAHRARLAATVAESERLLRLAGTVSRVGYWHYDARADALDWSDEVFRMHGVDAAATPPIARAIAFYHPDDRARVAAGVERALAEGANYQMAARIVRADDGAVRHVVVEGQAERDEDGVVTGLFGVIQDVTDRALAEQQLRASEERFRAITEQAGDMISLHDTDGAALFVSPSALSILGHDPAAEFGPSAFGWVAADDRPILADMRAQLLEGTADTSPVGRVRMHRADRTLAWVEVRARMTRIAGEQRVVAVWRDVSQQVADEAALRVARTQAEAALSAKADFLANMSHEIRTPMNGVIGFTELLLDSPLDDEQRRHAQLIADSGKAMMKLLNDILDISKIDAGQIDIVAEPMDLPHALGGCATLLRPAAEQKGLALALAIDPDLPRAVIGDALRLRQVVLNLIGNAIKFTAVGGVILSARCDGDTVLIGVRDTGIGIPPERQQAIFGQFVQADPSIARRYGGTGLGLAISNRLAALMGGHLRLESTPGHGTTVTLALPLAAVDVRALPVRPAAPATRPAPRRAAHVLLADDHDINQILVTSILARAGHRVTVTGDGIEAVRRVGEALAAGAPHDLVLMDMQMPGMDGLAAARAIRAMPLGRDLPIVALTANAYAADIEACRAAGMNDHLAKPVSAEHLLAAIDRWAPDTAARRPRRFAPSPELAAKYAAEKTATLEMLASAVRSGALADTTLDALADRLHRLAGTAAMFGDAALGDRARALELDLKRWHADERVARLHAAADALRDVA